MSLKTINRDLNSTGKKFFIENYLDVKEFWQNKISKDELIRRIKTKEDWQNKSDNSIQNKISSIKSFFDKEWNIDALKNTISSRLQSELVNKAKELFQIETGREYNETDDKILSESSSDLLQEILDALEIENIKELCDDEEFSYQKGTDKLIEFENYDGLTKEEITLLLNQFNESGLTFTKFIEALNIESAEYQLLTLLGELVSYCDLHAANKRVYNQYDDNRTLGKAGVRMNDWLDKLLSYKIADNDLDKLTPSIKNSLLYLNDPQNGLTMLSENHREKFSINLLDKNYIPESIVDDLISFFEPYDIEVSNEKNRTSVYCSILYSENVKQLWLNDNEIEVEEEKPNAKQTNDMKTPLNQIFYGPPGTGKTYNISSEAEKIISHTWKVPVSKNDNFWSICRYLHNINKYQDKSNSLYKTEKAILWMLGYIIKYDNFNISNSINKKDALEKGFDDSSSGWSQQAPFLTGFNFAEYTQSTVSLELNDSGIQLKEEAIEYLTTNGLTANDLIEWEKGKQDTKAPEFIQKAYCEKILKTTVEGFSPTMSTIYSTLNFLLNESTFPSSQTSWTDASDELRNKVTIYFNPTKPDGDIKWVCQFARVLYGLGLLKKENENYYLNENGDKLIENIISRWNDIKPELFSEKIDYENAVNQGFIEFITFHQSYSYEEFIEGIRPNLDDENNLSYSLEPGVFKRISDKAKSDIENNYVIIIDEINRGNISKIFGELITLIEPSKRLFSDNIKEHPKQVTLPYSKKLFGVPNNLYILGTMNTADKSIALLDSALRRRFSFTEMLPNSKIVGENITIEGIDVKQLFETINSRIEFLIDKDHMIGHSYFLKIKDNQTIESLALIFKNEVIPLLTEYFYGDFEKIQLVLGENKDWKSKSDSKFFNIKPSQQKTLFGKEEAVEGYDEKVIFELNDDLLGLNEDGCIKGKSGELTKLFKSVYTKKSN
jgi:hypothetical protein